MRNRTAARAVWIAVLGLMLSPLVATADKQVEKKEETKADRMQREIAEQRAASRALSHKMMGHVNLAELALNVGLPDEALGHVRKAKKIASQLQQEAPEVTSATRYKYGKLSYEFQNEEKHYYAPVFDDVFLLSDYRETHRAFKGADLEELDAGVVEVTVSVDLREVSTALESAEEKLAANDSPAARAALADIFKNAITDERVVTDPVWAVHDNVALAHNLVEDGNFDGARLALEHAKTRIAELEKKSDDAAANKEYKRMHEEITKVQAELRKKDPTLRQRLSDRISSWLGGIGGWYGEGYAGYMPPDSGY